MGNRYSQFAIPDPDWDVAVAGLFGELDVRALATRGIAWEAPESERTINKATCHCPLCSSGDAYTVGKKCVALGRSAAAERARVREAAKQNAIAENRMISSSAARHEERISRERMSDAKLLAAAKAGPVDLVALPGRFKICGEEFEVYDRPGGELSGESRVVRFVGKDYVRLFPIAGVINGWSVNDARRRLIMAGMLGETWAPK